MPGSDDTPAVRRDAIGIVLAHHGEALDRLADEVVRLNTDATARGVRLEQIDATLREIRAGVERLSAGVESLARVVADREARSLRQDTADREVAVARWGALSGTVTALRSCVTNPAVVGGLGAVGSPVVLAIVYMLARWLGVPVGALLGGAP